MRWAGIASRNVVLLKVPVDVSKYITTNRLKLSLANHRFDVTTAVPIGTTRHGAIVVVAFVHPLFRLARRRFHVRELMRWWRKYAAPSTAKFWTVV